MPTPDHRLAHARQAVLDDMADYLEELGAAEAGYGPEHVESVGKILEGFEATWKDLLASPSADPFQAALAQAIEALNALNDGCDFCLIETAQRELLAQYFNLASQALGLSVPSNDVTEELRDW